MAVFCCSLSQSETPFRKRTEDWGNAFVVAPHLCPHKILHNKCYTQNTTQNTAQICTQNTVKHLSPHKILHNKCCVGVHCSVCSICHAVFFVQMFLQYFVCSSVLYVYTEYCITNTAHRIMHTKYGSKLHKEKDTRFVPLKKK